MTLRPELEVTAAVSVGSRFLRYLGIILAIYVASKAACSECSSCIVATLEVKLMVLQQAFRCHKLLKHFVAGSCEFTRALPGTRGASAHG